MLVCLSVLTVCLATVHQNLSKSVSFIVLFVVTPKLLLPLTL